MADNDKEVCDLERELDAQILADHGFYPDSVEITNAGSGGSGFTALDVVTPVLSLIEKESEKDLSEDLQARDRETRLRTFEGIIRELIGNGKRLDPVDIGLTVLTWGWDLQVPPLNEMTQDQIGQLVAQGRAAICERHKRKVQRKKEAVGQKGTHSSRQKRAGIVKIYQKSAMGNTNRRIAAGKKKLAVTFGGHRRQ